MNLSSALLAKFRQEKGAGMPRDLQKKSPRLLDFFSPGTKSTLNIDFIQWHTQLNVCAVKLITHDLIHDFHFTFQAYTLPHTLNGICVSLFTFHA